MQKKENTFKKSSRGDGSENTESSHPPSDESPPRPAQTHYLGVLDLKAAVLQQGEAGVLPSQADSVLPPGDGGLGLSRCLTPQQRHASQHLCLVGRALADDGWWAIL